MNEAGFLNPKRDRWIRLRPALILLRDAREFATRTGKSPWEFAAELDELQAQGLTTTDLRWLISANIILHAIELSGAHDQQRSFERCNNLSFAPRSCFVLSEKGVGSITTEKESRPALDSPNLSSPTVSITNGRPVVSTQQNGSDFEQRVPPVWDPETRILKYKGELVKQFKWPAINQELIVNAFHEQGWPDMIHDPIPRDENINPKTRLHDTIKCLNRNHKNRLIRFHGNGDGTGVVWRQDKTKS